MRISIYVLLLVSALIITACVNDAGAGNTTPVAYSVSAGTQTGIDHQEILVIQSDAQYSALTSMATFTGDMPTVNFTDNDLIALFLGSNYGCGYDGLTINSVEENQVSIIVKVNRHITGDYIPGGTCVVPPTDSPYAFITVPKINRSVSLLFQ